MSTDPRASHTVRVKELTSFPNECTPCFTACA